MGDLADDDASLAIQLGLFSPPFDIGAHGQVGPTGSSDVLPKILCIEHHCHEVERKNGGGSLGRCVVSGGVLSCTINRSV